MGIDLTIGCAVYDDFSGLWFTVQHLRMNHREVLSRCELVIVDNNPSSPHGKVVKDFLGWVKGDFARVRYVPFPHPVGTSAPRQHVFDVAEGGAVLCMDSHVLPVPGSIQKLLDYYKTNQDTKDLLSGPMLYDDLTTYASHFNDEWRGYMWGTWGCDPRASDHDSSPFEVWGQGLGLFSCHREAWLGFNPKFRGFGGEEGYIHEKFRRAGARCLCLPFLRWAHRFGYVGGSPYTCTVEDRIHNYVIGHRELGIHLDRCREHFLSSGYPTNRFDNVVNGVEGKTTTTTPDFNPNRWQTSRGTSSLPPDPLSVSILADALNGVAQFATTFGQGYESKSVTTLDRETQ